MSLSAGFSYTANAAGRLLGTLLSSVLYQQAGVAASLWGAVALAAAAGIGALFLPPVAAFAVLWASAKGDDCAARVRRTGCPTTPLCVVGTGRIDAALRCLAARPPARRQDSFPNPLQESVGD